MFTFVKSEKFSASFASGVYAFIVKIPSKKSCSFLVLFFLSLFCPLLYRAKHKLTKEFQFKL